MDGNYREMAWLILRCGLSLKRCQLKDILYTLSDEELTRETLALENLNCGQFTLSSQLIRERSVGWFEVRILIAAK